MSKQLAVSSALSVAIMTLFVLYSSGAILPAGDLPPIAAMHLLTGLKSLLAI